MTLLGKIFTGLIVMMSVLFWVWRFPYTPRT